ncbi:hypothetical protein WJX72_002349 [[Myrmecia] bisecta]|uniref:Uncharacterized protein n=1 Tax=[Myrmecia] bisecta TaxID=41462 RepID=A0AAW1QEG9_9CHLO
MAPLSLARNLPHRHSWQHVHPFAQHVSQPLYSPAVFAGSTRGLAVHQPRQIRCRAGQGRPLQSHTDRAFALAQNAVLQDDAAAGQPQPPLLEAARQLIHHKLKEAAQAGSAVQICVILVDFKECHVLVKRVEGQLVGRAIPVCLIDFGLSMIAREVHPLSLPAATLQKLTSVPNAVFVGTWMGTSLYSGINQHLGYAPQQGDDWEAVAYLLITTAAHHMTGRHYQPLPWEVHFRPSAIRKPRQVEKLIGELKIVYAIGGKVQQKVVLAAAGRPGHWEDIPLPAQMTPEFFEAVRDLARHAHNPAPGLNSYAVAFRDRLVQELSIPISLLQRQLQQPSPATALKSLKTGRKYVKTGSDSTQPLDSTEAEARRQLAAALKVAVRDELRALGCMFSPGSAQWATHSPAYSAFCTMRETGPQLFRGECEPDIFAETEASAGDMHSALSARDATGFYTEPAEQELRADDVDLKAKFVDLEAKIMHQMAKHDEVSGMMQKTARRTATCGSFTSAWIKPGAALSALVRDSRRNIEGMAQRHSWRLELLLYYLVVGSALLHFVVRGVTVSSDAAGALAGLYGSAAHVGLQPGLLLGRQVDLSDIQWRTFREGLPLSTLVFAAFARLSLLVHRFKPSARGSFYVVAGLAFSAYLHQACVIFTLALLLGNFVLARLCAGRRFGPAAIWTANCLALLLVRWQDGFSFAAVSSRIAFLDSYRGPLRWHIGFNMLSLRMISFAMDLHWAHTGRKPGSRPAVSARGESVRVDDAKARQETSLALHHYSLAAYLAYVLYPPLYIAGPTMTFNSFASQLRHPKVIPHGQVACYALRCLAALLLLEGLTRTLYFNAVAKSGAWRLELLNSGTATFGPTEIAMTGFWVLAFMWLKFLVTWRFFRLWGLMDGIEAPENMLRCFANNYDIEGFWKSWHASYNMWLVRYMYIPLGGSATRLLNIWVIFTFVALWHDLEWRLLGWAWLMCAFFAPELGLKWALKQPSLPFIGLRQRWWYRHLCAAAAAVNITILMAINLVGFVLGMDGVRPFARQLFSQPRFAAAMFAVFFSAAQLMFHWRSLEASSASRTRAPDSGGTPRGNDALSTDGSPSTAEWTAVPAAHGIPGASHASNSHGKPSAANRAGVPAVAK